ncbi:MAG TPA: hypothetical protein VLA72_15845 [Anaerolineales bacterium]|nr:hypothetical protein [Anaerolineales bacterium]
MFLGLVVCCFISCVYGIAEESERIVEEVIRKRSDNPGIENAFASIASVDATWTKYFPNGPDWRAVSDEFGLPGYMGENDANIARDGHLVRSVIDLVGKGERVFVVAGSSHSVKIEAALRVQIEE